MDLPKVTPLVGGKVRTQTQAAMLDLLPDPAPPLPEDGEGGATGVLTLWGQSLPFSSFPLWNIFSHQGLQQHHWLLRH